MSFCGEERELRITLTEKKIQSFSDLTNIYRRLKINSPSIQFKKLKKIKINQQKIGESNKNKRRN